MNTLSDKSALLREVAIIDYVSGNQSEAARRNFEKLIDQDPALLEAVMAEQRFRADMQEAGNMAPVSMSNFDSLLTVIEQADEDEAIASASNVSTINEIDDFAGTSQPQAGANKTNSSWGNLYSVAASMAVLAMIFGGFYLNMSSPDFETLSSRTASEKIDFVDLVEQGRLAKIELSNKLSESEVDDILQSYKLSTFESGAPSTALYIISKQAMSSSDIDRLRADSRIQQVEVFSANGED